jgi:hypothetical protein
MLPFLASLFGTALPGMTAAGTAAGTTAMPNFTDMLMGSPGTGGGQSGKTPTPEDQAMKLATGAMNSAATGAKPSGTQPFSMSYGPQQQIDLSRLMAVLQNRSRLGS